MPLLLAPLPFALALPLQAASAAGTPLSSEEVAARALLLRESLFAGAGEVAADVDAEAAANALLDWCAAPSSVAR